MIYPTKNINQTQDMKELLLSQFSNSPNILKWLDIYGSQVQHLENEWFDLLDSLGVDTAYGYGLDLIGKEVQELRQGRNDDDYRSAILTKIFINNASGTPEDVIASTKQITGADHVYYSEQYPAGVVLEIIGVDYVSKAPIIRQTVPAAVDLIFQTNIPLEDVECTVGVAYSFVLDFESNCEIEEAPPATLPNYEIVTEWEDLGGGENNLIAYILDTDSGDPIPTISGTWTAYAENSADVIVANINDVAGNSDYMIVGYSNNNSAGAFGTISFVSGGNTYTGTINLLEF
jgi:hypothetical protein